MLIFIHFLFARVCFLNNIFKHLRESTFLDIFLCGHGFFFQSNFQTRTDSCWNACFNITLRVLDAAFFPNWIWYHGWQTVGSFLYELCFLTFLPRGESWVGRHLVLCPLICWRCKNNTVFVWKPSVFPKLMMFCIHLATLWSLVMPICKMSCWFVYSCLNYEIISIQSLSLSPPLS